MHARHLSQRVSLQVNRHARERSDAGLQVPTDTLLQLLRET